MQWHKQSTFMKSDRLSEIFVGQITVVEMRIMQMAMADVWHSPLPVDGKKRVIKLHASQYSHHYGVQRGGSYNALQAAVSLKDKRFRFKGSEQDCRWVKSISYEEGVGVLTIVLSDEVLAEIPLGCEYIPPKGFAWFDIAEAAKFSSTFTIRLFELLVQWYGRGETPMYPINDLRRMLGADNKYQRMTDFKRIAIKHPLQDINTALNWHASIEIKKRGRNISGAKFVIRDTSNDTEA